MNDEMLNYRAGMTVYGNTILDLTIIPTKECNFRCTYCYEIKENKFMKKEDFDTMYLFLSKEIRKYKVLNIDWFGGEPLLLREEIIVFMRKVSALCRRERVILVSNMTTNGYYLNCDIVERLAQGMVLYYQVTLDGIRGTHNKTRMLCSGDGTYDMIISNLMDIRNNSCMERVKILIRVNVTKEVEDKFDFFIKEMKDRFGGDKRFMFQAVDVRDWGGETIEEIRKSFVEKDNVKILNEKIRQSGLYTPQIAKNFGQGIICSASKAHGFIINYDCSLHKCTLAMEAADEHIRKVNCVGKIEKNGHMVLIEENQAVWVGYKKKEDEPCCTCDLYEKCHGTGCRYQVLSNNVEYCSWKEQML